MNLNNIQVKAKKRLFLSICMFIFMISFGSLIHKDWPDIFRKALFEYDEPANAVVTANVTRNIWPALLRVNSLHPNQVASSNSWMDNSHFQHIPPLFTYVPLPFYKMDGQVTVEVKRLSYAFLILLSGIIFILTVANFKKSYMATSAATLAVIIWIWTPFTRGLITGYDFGVSDIVLAFTVVCSFAALSLYLKNDVDLRRNYAWWKLALIGSVVSMPILTKFVLGAIPAATFFLLLLYDHKKITVKLLISLIAFLFFVGVYYGALYQSSPIAFKQEILTSFHHTQDYEGWGRPWHFFLTAYLPQKYTLPLNYEDKKIYYIVYGVIILIGLYFLLRNKFHGKTKVILSLSIGWFMWNLLVVSIIKTKSPNFIYQSYLFSLFFVMYVPMLLFSETKLYQGCKRGVEKYHKDNPKFIFIGLLVSSIVMLVLVILTYGYLQTKFTKTRSEPYTYSSEHEKFYELGEKFSKINASTRDLVVYNASKNDCWGRYYVLFLTGSEARTLDEIVAYNVPADILKNKYDKLYFVVDKSNNFLPIKFAHTVEIMGDFKVYTFNINVFESDYISVLQDLVLNSDKKNIYSSSSSCYWLPLKTNISPN